MKAQVWKKVMTMMYKSAGVNNAGMTIEDKAGCVFCDDTVAQN